MLLLDSSVCGLFKWRQFEPEVILLAVGWYLRFSLSYRDVEELLAERGLHAEHVTIGRSSTPTVTPLTHPRSLSSRVKERWTPAAGTGRCRTSITSWNKTTGRSNGGLTRVNTSS